MKKPVRAAVPSPMDDSRWAAQRRQRALGGRPESIEPALSRPGAGRPHGGDYSCWASRCCRSAGVAADARSAPGQAGGARARLRRGAARSFARSSRRQGGDASRMVDDPSLLPAARLTGAPGERGGLASSATRGPCRGMRAARLPCASGAEPVARAEDRIDPAVGNRAPGRGRRERVPPGGVHGRDPCTRTTRTRWPPRRQRDPRARDLRRRDLPACRNRAAREIIG